MPYPKNFVVRIIICVVLMYAVWIGIQYIMDVFIFHEPFRLGIVDYIVPPVTGVIEAYTWKPKENK
ncbi:MAG: hypothetical protein J6S63_07105 [Atopobiaceae bacterium]|nr:hypothetical protein [Atopobiaceae bacterium]